MEILVKCYCWYMHVFGKSELQYLNQTTDNNIKMPTKKKKLLNFRAHKNSTKQRKTSKLDINTACQQSIGRL